MTNRIEYKKYRYVIVQNGDKPYIRTKEGRISLKKVLSWQSKNGLRSYKVGGGEGDDEVDCDRHLETYQKLFTNTGNDTGFKQDSGNSVFKISPDGEKIIKIQLDENKDDILVDVMNALTITEIIVPNSKFVKHFPKFVDSYPLPICGKIPSTLATCDVGNKRCCKTVTYTTVKKPVSVWDYLNVTSGQSKNIDLKSFNAMLTEFFEAIGELGKYGFVHNDPTLDNVLVDQDSDTLVLIDYGRSVFTNDDVLPKIDKNIKFLGTQYGFEPQSYTGYIKSSKNYTYMWIKHAQLDKIKGHVQEDVFKYFETHLYMFDVCSWTIKMIIRNSDLRKAKKPIFTLEGAEMEMQFPVPVEDVYSAGLNWLGCFIENIVTYFRDVPEFDSIEVQDESGLKYHLDIRQYGKWMTNDGLFYNIDVDTDDGVFLSSFAKSVFKNKEKFNFRVPKGGSSSRKSRKKQNTTNKKKV